MRVMVTVQGRSGYSYDGGKENDTTPTAAMSRTATVLIQVQRPWSGGLVCFGTYQQQQTVSDPRCARSVCT